jgi:hypothetical protein
VELEQTNSASGFPPDLLLAFVDNYLSELSARGEKLDLPKVLASGPPQDIGGYPVTYYHMYMSAEGYAYADGPTVVIAELVSGAPIDSVRDAVVTILDNVFQR